MKTCFLLLVCFVAFNANAQYSLKFSPLSYTGSATTFVPELFATTASKNVMWVGVPELSGGTTCNYARTTNAGMSFTKSNVPETTNRGITSMAAIDSNIAWAATTDPTGSPAGNGGAIWKTSNGGTSWIKQTTTQFAAPGFINFLHFFNKDTGVAGGDPNGGYWEIYTTSNGGTTWTRVTQASVPSGPPNETGTYNCFSAVGKNFWFGTTAGHVVYSNDYGHSWLAATATSISGGTGIEMSDAMNGVAWDVTNGDINITTNGGVTWTPKTLGIAGGMGSASAARNVPGTYFYKIAGGGYYVTTNNFTSSTLIGNTPTGNLKGMKMFDNTLGWSQSSLKPDSAIVRITSAGGVSVSSINANVQHASILPNPMTTGAAIVNFSLTKAQDVRMILQDASGRVVRTRNSTGRTGDNAVIYDFTGLPTGFYALSIDDGSSRATVKVIIQ